MNDNDEKKNRIIVFLLYWIMHARYVVWSFTLMYAKLEFKYLHEFLRKNIQFLLI